MEKVDGVALARDVEVVEIAEEFRRALPEPEASSRRARGFLIHGLEHFERRGQALAFLVEDEGAVFHAAGSEEADVAGAGEFLRGAAGGGVGVCGRGWSSAGDGADGVEVIGDEGFVGKDEEEGEFFEDGDLGYAVSGNCLGGVTFSI